MERWGLRECQVSEVISFNYVCYAQSPEYGQVALKIGVPNPELFTEMKALELYGGRRICRCHESDVQLGAMLLERIIPGQDLTTVPGTLERTAIAARLIAGLPLPHAPVDGLPSFAGWMERAFQRVRREGKAGQRFLQLVDRAEQLYGELEGQGRPLCLLHGDLNHWNILYDAGGCTWKAIDPKGAMGPRCLEAGRFILNELGFIDPAEATRRVREISSEIGAVLGELPHVVAMCAFLDCVLSTSWTLEEHVERDISGSVEQAELLLQAIDDLR